MAARTMRNALLPCMAVISVLIAQNSQGSEIGRPQFTATLERATGAIEPSPASTARDEAETPSSVPSADPAPPKGNPLWAIPLRALAATRDRPLFSVSRRPPSPAIPGTPDPAASVMPVVIKSAEPERPPLVLVGTIVSAGVRIAVLLNQTTKLVTRLREGEEESGWRVKTILLRSTVLERDARSVKIELPKTGNDDAPTGTISEISAPLNRRNLH
jgi:hypothetical protein